MIKTDAQREGTIVQIARFRRALRQVHPARASRRSAAIWSSYARIIRQLEGEIREYNQLKPGDVVAPKLERLDHIASFIVKIRIAKGISQTELARRLRVSKQVISRLEESDYQTAGIQTIQRVLDALGVRTAIILTAPRGRGA